MGKHDPSTGKKLSPDDQARMLRLTEEVQARQIEMALIIGRYLNPPDQRREGNGIPIQDKDGKNIGCYDGERGLCYPIPADGVC